MIPETEIPARRIIYRLRLWAMFAAYNFFMWVRPRNVETTWAINTQAAPGVTFPERHRGLHLIPVDAANAG